jgi:arylformamidase
MRSYLYLSLLIMACFFSSCATKKIKDIAYLDTPIVKTAEAPKLNIFKPRDKEAKGLPVLIFVHGGNWNSGSKNTYGFFGRNFAKKGVVTVIPDYTLSPTANYDDMTAEIAACITWVNAHIADYGGDPQQVYITGHSAGGHLAALSVLNPKYGIPRKAIKGIILNDAAGLDMKNYLRQNPPGNADDYIATWTSNPDLWHNASPIYFVNKEMPPFLVYVGEKTYGSITEANINFGEALTPYQSYVQTIRPNKKHVGMITQYVWPWSDRFDEIIAFMKGIK